MADIENGVIVSSMGESFKVMWSGGVSVCKPRGVLRIGGVSPCCGDRVGFCPQDGVILSIHERKNQIIRPPLANLDSIVFVVSTCEPYPNLLLLDKFLAVAEYKGISPVIVFTKIDKLPPGDYLEVYKRIYPVFCVCNITGEGLDGLLSKLKDRFSAVAGNSGSGKSSLLNNLCPELGLKTQEISKKLGRGKHTTRRTDIYPLECGGCIADTPGFSSFETGRYDTITAKELPYCFPEFSEHLGDCRFPDCTHSAEPDCGVLNAVSSGLISRSRHESYKAMLEEAKRIKPWELDKKR